LPLSFSLRYSYPDQSKWNRENIKSGHDNLPSSTLPTQAGDENPHSTQGMMSTSRGMPPQFKIPYKRGRTMHVPSAGEQMQLGSQKQNFHAAPKDALYYVQRAGLSPRDAHVGRFHKDVHDGELQSDYVISSHKIKGGKPDGKYHFVNPNRPKSKENQSLHDHSRDVSAFSDNCPDWMHIPLVPIVPAKYKTGCGGAEVVSGAANNASAWHRFDHDNPNQKIQHPHDVTVNSQAAPEWMHSPRKDLKDTAPPMKWRRPEPMTTQHNIQTAHGRSQPGEKGHNYHYLRHPDQQRVGYDAHQHKHSEQTRSKDGCYKSIPHASAVSKYGPGHFHIQGVPLLKFQHPKSDPSAGVYVHGVRPQTADTPRTTRKNHPSTQRGAISYDAPPHMKVPGIKVSGGPVPDMPPTTYGSDREAILSDQVRSQIKKKVTTGRRKKMTANNPQHKGSTVLGRAPSNPDGTPIHSKPVSLKEQAKRNAMAAKGNVIVPARPSTSSNDGRHGNFLGSRRSRSKRASATLSVPYATHYPANPHAPLPFWTRMDIKRQQKQQQQQQQQQPPQQQPQQQQQQRQQKLSNGKENGIRQAAKTNVIQQPVTNAKERKIAQLRAEIARLERG